MTHSEMIKLAVRLSEIRPLWRALRSQGVRTTRNPGAALMSHFPADRSPLGYVKAMLRGKRPRDIEQLNIPRGYQNPLGTWLHEAGHGLDKGRLVRLEGPRADLTNEVIANRNVQRALSPESYAKIRPALTQSFQSHGIGTPLLAARQATPELQAFWESVAGRGSQLPHEAKVPLVKAVRRQMARRSPEFKAQFKDKVFNLQDLLKQTP